MTNAQLITCVAVAGAGKTRVATSLVVRHVGYEDQTYCSHGIDEGRSQQCVVENRANIGLFRSFKSRHLFSTYNVHLIHSIALAANKLAEDIYHPFCRRLLIRAVDEALAAARLKRIKCVSFASFWQNRAQNTILETLAAAEEVLNDHNNDELDDEELGLELYKNIFSSVDPALASAGFKEMKPSELVASLRLVRKEILEKNLPYAITSTEKSDLISRANRWMEEDGVVDHMASIKAFADSGEAICGAGELLVVDEAQDMTRSQSAIVRNTLLAGACVLLVGDPSQGVMVFAGADVNPIYAMQTWGSTLNKFNTHQFRLTVNFRSSSQIVDASERVLPDADIAILKLKANFEGDPVQLINPDNERDEAQFVGKRVYDNIRNGTPLSDIAIISYRNIGWGSEIAVALRNLHVPFTIRGKSRDTSSPAGRLLPALQVGLGLGEFAHDIEEQAMLLQSFVRALNGCSFTEEVRQYVIATATERHVDAVTAYLNHTEEILQKTECDSPSEWSGKRICTAK